MSNPATPADTGIVHGPTVPFVDEVRDCPDYIGPFHRDGWSVPFYSADASVATFSPRSRFWEARDWYYAARRVGNDR